MSETLPPSSRLATSDEMPTGVQNSPTSQADYDEEVRHVRLTEETTNPSSEVSRRARVQFGDVSAIDPNASCFSRSRYWCLGQPIISPLSHPRLPR
jgi:hypothetical protein